MKYRFVILIILLVLCSTQARADLTLGIVPAAEAPLRTRSQAEKFTRYLDSRLESKVTLRIFQDEKTLQRWLSRYREVDLALFSRSFYEQTQNGAYQYLADYLPTAQSRATKVDTLVARRGLAKKDLQSLKDVLMVMDTDMTGGGVLAGLTVEQYASPSTKVRVKSAQQKPPVVKLKPVAVAKQSVKPVPVVPQSPPKPHPIAAVAANPQAPPPRENPLPRYDNAPATTESQPQTTAPTVITPPLKKLPINKPADTASAPAALLRLQVGTKSPSPTEPVLDTRQKRAASFPLWPLAVLVLLSGLAVKGFLLLQRSPRTRPVMTPATTLIQHDWAELYPETTAATDPDNERTETPTVKRGTSPDDQSTIGLKDKLKPLPVMKSTEISPEFDRNFLDPGANDHEDINLNLGGTLTSAQVPAMLRFIAAMRREGKLLVRSEFDEKTILFKNGEIVDAASVNLAHRHQSGFLMNKLGYLLLRQGKISEEARDQALVLCENNPEFRLGEALLKLGLLDAEDLKASLRDQAKMILHSMIVFPEGKFKFVPEELHISQEQNLGINVVEFLKGSASHRNEWRNIRQLIPSLDVVLNFTPGGKEKINSSRMSVHQKFVLSLIDGCRPVREICQETTMLDYELYRFVYQMLKANILERVNPPKLQPA